MPEMEPAEKVRRFLRGPHRWELEAVAYVRYRSELIEGLTFGAADLQDRLDRVYDSTLRLVDAVFAEVEAIRRTRLRRARASSKPGPEGGEPRPRRRVVEWDRLPQERRTVPIHLGGDTADLARRFIRGANATELAAVDFARQRAELIEGLACDAEDLLDRLGRCEASSSRMIFNAFTDLHNPPARGGRKHVRGL